VILQRYGLVEGTPDDEASSLLLRYVCRPGPFLRPEGYGRRDVLLQFALLLCLVGAAGYKAEPDPTANLIVRVNLQKICAPCPRLAGRKNKGTPHETEIYVRLQRVDVMFSIV
jgi:hypothetical protein